VLVRYDLRPSATKWRAESLITREATLIEVDHLTKSYGQSSAVNDISFSVGKGEILGFLGPNGAGKTTTMRMLTGYLPASGGTARIAGFDVFEQSMEVRKRIGYLPETPPLYPEMTIEDYLTFVARIKGVPRASIDDRVDEAMEKTNLLERRDDLIKRLSRGFKQRVGIAQAIVHDPDVVILDEPTVGLDPNQIKDVRQLIKALAGKHTIILSTHILPEVEMTCDRVVIINRGRIAAIDTTQNLRRQYEQGTRIVLGVRNGSLEVQEKLELALQKIEGVQHFELALQEELGQLTATVESAPGLDLRAPIASQVISNGLDLVELRTISVSLEDIFMQLTTEDSSSLSEEQELQVREDSN
jgi:ABC-2 type transport system ATP-binding protein